MTTQANSQPRSPSNPLKNLRHHASGSLLLVRREPSQDQGPSLLKTLGRLHAYGAEPGARELGLQDRHVGHEKTLGGHCAFR